MSELGGKVEGATGRVAQSITPSTALSHRPQLSPCQHPAQLSQEARTLCFVKSLVTPSFLGSRPPLSLQL